DLPQGGAARHRPQPRQAGRAGPARRGAAGAPDRDRRRLVGAAATARLTMISTDQARQFALDLPGTVEQDHHGRPSFRVTKRIFASLWDERHMNVMLDEPGIMTAV